MSIEMTPDGELRLANGTHIGWLANGRLKLNIDLECDGETALAILQPLGNAIEQAFPTELIDIDLPFLESDTDWPEGEELLLEMTTSIRGQVIRVHKNDPDTWPSDFHGHVLNKPRHKVDVYTGKIYRTTDKRCVGALGKRDLGRLHDNVRKYDWGKAKLDGRQLT